MRLADLHPDLIGTSGGLNQLTFDCPLCGPPHKIQLTMKLGGPPKDGIFGWTHDGTNITVEPSIHNHEHGRKKQCGYHCRIINGEVTPA
jgi:hypothetical protein